jgi:hypothetical protein
MVTFGYLKLIEQYKESTEEWKDSYQGYRKGEEIVEAVTDNILRDDGYKLT